jgi:site-specific recombinase XerD
MGKLREKMLSDLELRNYSQKTKTEYIRCATNFAAHFWLSPELMGEDHVRRFLLHLVRVRRASPSVLKMHVAALKFLYRITLNRPEEVDRVPYPKTPKRLPDVLSQKEIADILHAVESLKYRTIIAAAYAGGLRITEACSLKCRGDIDSNRMQIHVRGAKGAKDRFVMLSERLLMLLRQYWEQAKPQGIYLFPGKTPDQPITPASVYRIFKKALKTTGITKHVTLHTLRHSCATHLMEAHTDIRVIQAILGHGSIRTTCRYTHVSATLAAGVKSPFDSVSFENNLPMA